MGEKGGIARSCVRDTNSYPSAPIPSPALPYHSSSCPPPLPPSAVGLVRLLAALLQPYTPSLSAKVLLQLNLPDSTLLLNDELIQVGEPLALTWGPAWVEAVVMA